MRLKFLHKYAEPDRHFDSEKEALDLLAKNSNPISTFGAISHPGVKKTPKLVDAVVDHLKAHGSSDSMIDYLHEFKDHLEPHHIDAFINEPDNYGSLQHVAPYAKTDAHVDYFLNRKFGMNNDITDHGAMRNVLKSDAVTSDHIGKIIRSDAYPTTFRTVAIQSFKTHPKDVEWAADFSNHGHSSLTMKAREIQKTNQEFDDLFGIEK